MMKKKVAVLFWGLPRRIDLTIESIKTNLFDTLDRAGYKVTIFFHSFVMAERYSNSRSGEKDIEPDPSQYKYLKAKYFEYDIHSVVSNKLGLAKYRTMGNPWSGKDYQTLDNFILASYSKYRVTEMMEDCQQSFDYVIYIRPDLRLLNPFPVHTLQTLDGENKVLVADFHLFGKYRINDRFAGCTFRNYRVFGYSFVHMYTDSKTMLLHSETYIGYLYKRNGVGVVYIPFYFNRVRANGIEKKDYVKEDDTPDQSV